MRRETAAAAKNRSSRTRRSEKIRSFELAAASLCRLRTSSLEKEEEEDEEGRKEERGERRREAAAAAEERQYSPRKDGLCEGFKDRLAAAS